MEFNKLFIGALDIYEATIVNYGSVFSKLSTLLESNNILYYYNLKEKSNSLLARLSNNLQSTAKVETKRYYSKYYFIGLGYKMFIYQNFLFIWVGLTHYTLIEIPLSIQIFCKKRRIYIIGTDLMVLKAFLNRIRKVRKKDIYKGKGLLEVKSYKGFVRMKTGKKKQYN